MLAPSAYANCACAVVARRSALWHFLTHFSENQLCAWAAETIHYPLQTEFSGNGYNEGFSQNWSDLRELTVSGED